MHRKIARINGVTVVRCGQLKIKTNKINRARWNDLRKLDTIKPLDVWRAIFHPKQRLHKPKLQKVA